MAKVKWIKIRTDMFEDEKIDFISSLPEADSIIVIWVRLLTLAGKCNAGGYIYLTEKIPYTEEMLAHKFKKPINTIKLAFETFRKLDMVELDSMGMFLPNWEKHQNVDGLEKLREQGRERQARYREKQKLLPAGSEEGNVTCNITVTQSNETEEEVDKELDLDKELDNTSSAIRALLSLIKGINGWNYDFKKDSEMIETLLVEFPKVDFEEQIKKMKAWLVDNPFKVKSNRRLFFRNWITNADKFNQHKKEHSQRPGVQRKSHTSKYIPGSPDKFKDFVL